MPTSPNCKSNPLRTPTSGLAAGLRALETGLSRPHLIFDNRNLFAVLLGQDMVEKCGLARAEKASDDSHGHLVRRVRLVHDWWGGFRFRCGGHRARGSVVRLCYWLAACLPAAPAAPAAPESLRVATPGLQLYLRYMYFTCAIESRVHSTVGSYRCKGVLNLG